MNGDKPGAIEINGITAFVGQNEAGRSNLFEALYRINPFAPDAVTLPDRIRDRPRSASRRRISCRRQIFMNAIVRHCPCHDDGHDDG